MTQYSLKVNEFADLTTSELLFVPFWSFLAFTAHLLHGSSRWIQVIWKCGSEVHRHEGIVLIQKPCRCSCHTGHRAARRATARAPESIAGSDIYSQWQRSRCLCECWRISTQRGRRPRRRRKSKNSPDPESTQISSTCLREEFRRQCLR